MATTNKTSSSFSSSSKQKLHQLPHSGSLVGGIIEKGFSSSSAPKPPQPSILPFPIARHRSHGPHWAPGGAEVKDDEEKVEEEKDADYEPISSFAKPIERRKKKGLDLSSWKEIMKGDDKNPEHKKKVVKKKVHEIKTLKDLEVASSSSTYSVVHSKRKNESESRMRNGDTKNLEVTNSSSTNGITHSEREQKTPTLMDEIEAENLGRLSQMTTHEIAEAQAEMMEKMDPGILEMLKKRGRGKSGKKKGIEGQIEGNKRSKTGASDGDLMPPGEISNNSWKIWSERVEKVRDLRFALDGSVVEGGFDQDQPNGNKLDSSQYNVENVATRDFLRTEGDPAAVGYTIKEAVELMRSMVPGQRVLALQLLASVFTKALYNMQAKDGGHIIGKISSDDKLVDWQAVWAFALGPEPQMALSLRIALDDNHDSVVLACAKAIQGILSCDINEGFFNITEKVPAFDKYLCTAPVFRSKPEIDGGYLHGGFWKYNTKPSNILPSNDEKLDNENEGQPTIQDDMVVAGQDIAAGFVRMGILPRICYLLEMDPIPTLEECLLSVLIGLARHSPTSATAVMRCPRLIDSVIKMCTRHGTSEIPVQIKAIVLLKVLFQSDKQICSDFVKRGIFHQVMWQWYRSAFTLEHWVHTGREHCKLSSTLMVEQLRLWRVCIHYGYCVSYFSDLFPSMCLWLTLPKFEKLIANNVLSEFASISTEVYLVLEALAQNLPILHSVNQLNKQAIGLSDDTMEAWSWSHVVPMVDLAIDWLALENIPFVSRSSNALDLSASCMIWVISAVMHMLSSILDRIAPLTIGGMHNDLTHLPWLPEFVPKVGLEIVRNGFLKFTGVKNSKPVEFPTQGGSLVYGLSYLREQSDFDASLSSISCLHGLIRLALSIDHLVQRAKNVCCNQPLELYMSQTNEKILEEGLVNWGKNDLVEILSVFMDLISSEWQTVQSIEMFGRGGPAPGIGYGWGSSNGGFWSANVLLAQMDAKLILELFEFIPLIPKETFESEVLNPDISRRVNSVLAVCLSVGPGNRGTLEKAFDTLLQASVLKYLNFCIHSFIHNTKGRKSFELHYEEGDYKLFSEVLNSHFKSEWISIKKKPSSKDDSGCNNHDISYKSNTLETIHEDQEITEIPVKYRDCSSLLIEWAHQRLPLPMHWILSAICSIGDPKNTSTSSNNIRDIAKSGLFLLLGLESMRDSLISDMSLVWKLHALSMALHASMDVLDDEKSRDIFETLQEMYGQHLEKLRCRKLDFSIKSLEAEECHTVELLKFQTQIHGSYTTFVENLVEQFGAVSYGDVIFGRQVALYLHRYVERPIRLAVWNALSNARVLELLPPLEKCLAEPEGYLMPVEEDEGVLEAYVKSWASGALDRAAARESISFTLALHHISCFIFKPNVPEKSSLQLKLARSLLRSYVQKKNQEGMLLSFVRYKLPLSQDEQQYEIEITKRFDLLKEACEGSSSLLAVVNRLKSIV